MEVWGFDSKEFTRTRIAEHLGDAAGEKQIERERCFHTPLGVGVRVRDPDALRQHLQAAFDSMKRSRGIESPRLIASSAVVRKWCQDDIGASVAECERVVESVISDVTAMHFSFAALSTRVMPTISTGGYASPAREMPTPKFLESLCPMYSYLTAWSAVVGGHQLSNPVRIDAFESKQTDAWSRLCNETTPQVYYKGDEVDPVVCLADIVAFATDRLLYRSHRKLEPTEIERLWAPKGPEISTWIIGKGNVDKVVWASDEPISHAAYVKHPIVFLVRDRPEAYATRPKGRESLSVLLQGGEPFESAIRLATIRQGCLKFFNEYDDPPLIQNGDIFIYAGSKSTEVVGLYKDMYEIETYTFKEARTLAMRSR